MTMLYKKHTVIVILFYVFSRQICYLTHPFKFLINHSDILDPIESFRGAMNSAYLA